VTCQCTCAGMVGRHLSIECELLHNTFTWKGLPMKNMIDSQSIEVPCPHCGHKLSETIGKLKTNSKLTCPKCKGTISIDANQMRGEIAKVEQALAKLQRSLSSFGK